MRSQSKAVTFVAETAKLLVRVLGEDIALVTELGTSSERANLDPGQLEEIVDQRFVTLLGFSPAESGDGHALETIGVGGCEPVEGSL